jgi:uncharacterized protein with HEPN domain
MLNASLLSIIEEAGVAVLTLTEGLEKDEFLDSRLTRAETLRYVRTLCASAANVPAPTRALLPEIEWRGWQSVAPQLDEESATQGEALWFAIRSLVPATLMWLRVYRKNQPEVFKWLPAPVADGARP